MANNGGGACADCGHLMCNHHPEARYIDSLGMYGRPDRPYPECPCGCPRYALHPATEVAQTGAPDETVFRAVEG
jgi:hypothetical protein